MVGFLGITASLSFLIQVFHGGNNIEEFAIPLQVAAVFFFLMYERKSKSIYAVACGASISLLFFLRQNLIGVGIAIIILYFLRLVLTRKWQFKFYLFSFAGFVILSTFFILIIYSHYGLAEFWEATFVSNFDYSTLGLIERINVILVAVSFLAKAPVFWVALVAWAIALVYLVQHHYQMLMNLFSDQWFAWLLFGLSMFSFLVVGWVELTVSLNPGIGIGQGLVIILGIVMFVLFILSWILRKKNPGFLNKPNRGIRHGANNNRQTLILTAYLCVWFPIEFFLLTLSDRNYLHYYIALFSPIAFLITWLFGYLYQKLSKRNFSLGWEVTGGIWSLVIISSLFLSPIVPMRDLFSARGDQQILDTAQYITENSQPNESVLIWGAEPLVNFISGRQVPSRFVFLYHLFLNDEAAVDRTAIFLSDLREHQPLLIIDSLNEDFVDLHPQSIENCVDSEVKMCPEMNRILEYIYDNYALIGKIGPESWWIFLRR